MHGGPFGRTGMLRRGWVLAVPSVAAVALVCGCGFFPVNVASDVPCVTLEWESEDYVSVRGFRNERADGGRFLFTGQTSSQFEDDLRENGRHDYSPREGVYAYDIETRTLELVDDSAWDLAEGPVIVPTTSGGTENFNPIATGSLSGLSFMGQPVAVAGGGVLSVLDSNSDSPYVAIISFSGRRRPGLFSSGGANGQYYHQIFSDETGRAVSHAVRLGLGDGERFIWPGGAWTSDNRYVVYQSGYTFCFADGITE